MRQTKIIVMDEFPNTMRNRLIRLVENWSIIRGTFNIDTDKEMLEHIYNVMFKDVRG